MKKYIAGFWETERGRTVKHQKRFHDDTNDGESSEHTLNVLKWIDLKDYGENEQK